MDVFQQMFDASWGICFTVSYLQQLGVFSCLGKPCLVIKNIHEEEYVCEILEHCGKIYNHKDLICVLSIKVKVGWIQIWNHFF